MIACNLQKKNDFRTMPFMGLAFFADVKRITQVRAYCFVLETFEFVHFTRKNESFLHKRSSSNYHSFSAIECQLTAFAWLLCFFSEIMLDLVNIFRPYNSFLLNFW